ncbi:MAG: glycosyltransferase family 39 protein, partial [Candidatus Coatesbacteria bacterium]
MGGRKKLFSLLALAVILLIGAAFRLWLVPAQLPYHYVADEFQVVERALRVGAGNPNPGLFTWPGSLVIYLDFLLYAGFFGAALISGAASSASEFARLYWTNPTAFYLLARVLSAAFGLLAVWAVYYITAGLYKINPPGDTKYSTAAGLFAAVAFALMPQAIISSAQALPDMAATALALAALAVAVGTTAESGWKRAAFVGLLLGFAVASKYHAVLYIVPIAGLYFFPTDTRSGRLKSVAFVCGGLIVGFILSCPFAVLDFPTLAADWSMMLAR